MEFTVLNSKEKKHFHEKLRAYFGLAEDFEFQGVLFSTDKNKYFLAADKFRDVAGKVNSKVVGLYVAELNEYGEIRLSIEGTQVIGPLATKHIWELTTEEARKLMFGEDLDFTEKDISNEYYILYVMDDSGMKDYLGCGKVKMKKLLNFTPKGRRVH